MMIASETRVRRDDAIPQGLHLRSNGRCHLLSITGRLFRLLGKESVVWP